MTRTVAILTIALLWLGCGKSKTDFFEGTAAKDAIAAISDKIGGDVRAIRIEVWQDQVRMTAQDPAKPAEVKFWWYADGKVGGPKPVTLGSGSLEASLFKVASVDFALVPQIAREGKDIVGKPLKNLELRIPILEHRGTELEWTVWCAGDRYTTATPAGVVAKLQAGR
jgi:hypothetical protein